MKYNVDGWNNFCRVFEFPERFSSEFCFGGGIPTVFKMVDWFNPVPGLPQPAIDKIEWFEKYGEIEKVLIDEEWVREKAIPWICKKVYIKQGRKYLIIFDCGLSVIFNN